MAKQVTQEKPKQKTVTMTTANGDVITIPSSH